jgi:hypothetical protein
MKPHLMRERNASSEPEAAVVDRHVLRARRVQPLQEYDGHDGVQMVLLCIGVEQHFRPLVASPPVVRNLGRRGDYTSGHEHCCHQQRVLVPGIEPLKVRFTDERHPWTTPVQEIPQ